MSLVALTNVVVRAVPFHRTTEPETKPSPLTVSVNAGPPTAALFGDSDVSVGTLAVAAVIRTIDATDGTPLLFRMNSM